MASSSSSGAATALRPVFVFPNSLDFYLEDQTTHKRVLTIYNPFDVDITFKVLCNNPNNYCVVEPEGTILGQKCTDIVFRHIAVSPKAVQQTDKFRIHIYDEGSSEVVGKRDVLATLHPGIPDPSDPKHGKSLPQNRGRDAGKASIMPPSHERTDSYLYANHDGPPTNYVVYFAAFICIIALCLPTEGDDSIFVDYPFLHLTVNQKIVFAYVLGLVTMAILRTT